MRLLADLTGDGRADIVAFGDAGVYVALSNGDGTFAFTPVPVIGDFGFEAGGWQVDKHPRFVADLTGDGRADIVGFGDRRRVRRVRATATARSTTPRCRSSATSASTRTGRWTSHPRFVADLTGDRCAEIIGFGDAGVLVGVEQRQRHVRATRAVRHPELRLLRLRAGRAGRAVPARPECLRRAGLGRARRNRLLRRRRQLAPAVEVDRRDAGVAAARARQRSQHCPAFLRQPIPAEHALSAGHRSRQALGRRRRSPGCSTRTWSSSSPTVGAFLPRATRTATVRAITTTSSSATCSSTRSIRHRRFAVGLGGAFMTTDGVNWQRLLDTGAMRGRPANCYFDWISRAVRPGVVRVVRGTGHRQDQWSHAAVGPRVGRAHARSPRRNAGPRERRRRDSPWCAPATDRSAPRRHYPTSAC